ncbi:glycerophosphodiester phosphodiesterase [Peribacillus muralis]|uniref:glycerophosphodiester phosphodiesterase n=1 Tax=Peribacillus muralis TaxID=264697 RepID=UPI001F4E0717|nr:glycerophosphodiester phosphodiesterase [Peribacillus muralis]MCK1993281.1 glycerophosphodiester phosphodiesterase [Peribacillus muralis]MCK2013835.1 glycerophosphodiester phosphodiesterase [Peribacillus muralis]
MKKSLKNIGISMMSAAFILQAASMSASAAHESRLSSPIYEKDIVNIAHRGASGYAPEHTIPAYQLGERMKGDYIEIDLQLTKDGRLIAMHDERVDRTTDGTGLVKDLTLTQIKKLDAGSWFNETYPQMAKQKYEGLAVPTLEEVFKKFGKQANYYIETKSPEVYPGMEEELLKVLKDYKMVDSKGRTKNVLIQSFSRESLLKVHDLNPQLPLVQLFSYKNQASITDEELESIKQYAIGIGPNFNKVDKQYVKMVRNHDLQFHPYTVNERADMKKALEWGATGVFTNYPNLFNEVLREHEHTHRLN